jgi:transposase
MKGYAPVMNEPGPQPRVLLADKGYDADFIHNDLAARGVAGVIPAKRNRKVQPVIDGHIYALRNLVERCFAKLKHSRRLATRYDKTADSFLGFILVASIRLWVRHFVHTTYKAARTYNIGAYNRPQGWSDHRWAYGQVLPRAYWASEYLIGDYWLFAL